MNDHRMLGCPRSAAPARQVPGRVFAFALCTLAFGAATQAWGQAGRTELVSVNRSGTGAGGAHTSAPPHVSANGRYVLYGRRYTEVLLRDRWSDATELVSLAATGEPVPAQMGSLSGDARFVTFTTGWPTVVPGDSNGVDDVFLRDRLLGTTERISVNSNEVQGNGDSRGGVVSDDGRIVVFTSQSTNLAGTNASSPPIFVRDRALGTTRRLVPSPPWGLSGYGSERISISADGRHVAFEAYGPAPLDELNVFVHDRSTNVTRRVSTPVHGGVLAPSGVAEWPSISANGRYVAFSAYGNDYGTPDPDTETDVYVFDRETGAYSWESYGSAPWVRGLGWAPSLSGDGRFVAFGSYSWNLVPGQPARGSRGDVYTRDRLSGTIERNSLDWEGGNANDVSIWPAISRNGRWVAFKSRASDLVPNDGNFVYDIYINDRGAP